MQRVETNIKGKSNFKKNIIWFFIILFILAVVMLYNLMLKASIKDFEIFDFLKHPDKIPAHVLDERGKSQIKDVLGKFNPFKKNIDKIIVEKVDQTKLANELPLPLIKTDNQPVVNEISEIENLENKDLPLEQFTLLNDNEEIIRNNQIDKKNIFIDSYKLSIYRHFLSDIQMMLINFAQDKAYQDSLDKVKFFINSLPELCEINSVINMLEIYNEKYLASSPEYTKSVIPKYGAIKKFIKVEKNSTAYAEKEELKNQIYKNLNSLINFIYSNKTEQFFLNSNL